MRLRGKVERRRRVRERKEREERGTARRMTNSMMKERWGKGVESVSMLDR